MLYNCAKFKNNPRGSVEKHPQICWIDMEWPVCDMFQEVNHAYDNAKEVDCLDVTKEGNDAWDATIKR